MADRVWKSVYSVQLKFIWVSKFSGGYARPSPKDGKDGHHHPLITRFHPTSGLHDPHSVRWAFPLEFKVG